MGIIRRQGIQSSVLIYTGFALGAFNILVLFPRFLTQEQAGLIFLFVALSKIILGFSTLGTIPTMTKFFPYYKAYLPKGRNDFLFASFVLPLIGFTITTIALLVFKDFFIRKSIEKSALFLDYYYWIIPFSFLFIVFSILEVYSSTNYKTIFPTLLREIGVRAATTFLILAFIAGVIGFPLLIVGYSLMFGVLSLLLLGFLRYRNELDLSFSFSKVTRRMKGSIFSYSSYIYGGVIVAALAENADVLIIGGIAGLANVAVYQTGHFVATIIQVPYRSIAAISSPMLSQAWKDRNIKLVDTIYKKTAINQLLAALFLFGLIWVNMDLLLALLGDNFNGVKEVIFLLGITRVIDLGFGVNSEILNYSKHWRFNFFSYIILVVLFLPATYLLVKEFGFIGSAVANLLSFFLFNAIRFLFLWLKLDLFPFNWKTMALIFIGLFAIICTIFIETNYLYLNCFLKSACFLLLFLVPVWLFQISEDVNQFIRQLRDKYFG
ncbi:MAG TPA: hypothetical protein DIW47_04215 [Bacteroidetes bacterium]|nr:hypothetical protein [Bacteroidota bacterium]